MRGACRDDQPRPTDRLDAPRRLARAPNHVGRSRASLEARRRAVARSTSVPARVSVSPMTVRTPRFPGKRAPRETRRRPRLTLPTLPSPSRPPGSPPTPSSRSPPPQRTCSAQGGALPVVSDPLTTLQVVERDSLILACVSERVSADALLARYDATDQGDTRHRVNALRTTLGDLHETDGAFAVVLYDAAAGRVMAARTANSLPLAYGFTADGVLVACAGLTAERLMPGAGMDLTPFPAGGSCSATDTSSPSSSPSFGVRRPRTDPPRPPERREGPSTGGYPARPRVASPPSSRKPTSRRRPRTETKRRRKPRPDGGARGPSAMTRSSGRHPRRFR